MVDDEGFYICSIGNSFITKFAQAQLTINGIELNLLIRIQKFMKSNKSYLIVPPTFIKRPYDQETFEGNSVEFYCSASGKPKPVIIWKKNGIN